MGTPKVSTVTAIYNDKEHLKQILEQLQTQTYDNIEFVIVDGGSTDGTLEVIRDFARRLETEQAAGSTQRTLRWISEPDKGIYDAINKGIRLSTGDILGCCFDEFAAPDVLEKMVGIMEQEKTDGVHGDLYYMEGEKVVRRWHQGQGRIRFGWMPGHPTLYLRREVYEKYGLYKTDYRISADYEFMIRILKDESVKLSYLPEILIHMEHGGTSTNSLGAYLAGMKEGHRALRENGVRFAWFTDLCRVLRVLAQFR